MSAWAAAAAVGAACALLVRPPAESRVRPPGRSSCGGPPAVLLLRVRRSAARPSRGAGPAVRGRAARPPAPAPSLDDVVTLLDRLAALLRAGLGPRTVWEHLADAAGACRPMCAFVAESLAAGGDPGRAVAGAAGLVRDASGRTGRAGLRRRRVGGPGGLDAADVLLWLAVATDVSARTGAPAADCIDRLAGAVRAELVAADERASALAGPQATAQVLAWLPAGGVVLGALVGADPVRTLLLTGPGRGCLVAGGALWLAGRSWSRALVRSAARAGG